MDDTAQTTDRLIEQALAQRALAPLPPGFVDQLMTQIQTVPVRATRESIRYRVELPDIAFSLLGASLMVLALGLSGHLAVLGIAAPIAWTAVLPTAWAPTNWPALIGLFVFAEICFGALFCVWMWLDQPLTLVNGEV